jgi:hypothetical protein
MSAMTAASAESGHGILTRHEHTHDLRPARQLTAALVPSAGKHSEHQF